MQTGSSERRAGGRRAVLDILVQIVGKAFNVGFGVIVAVVLARSLGETGFGRWSTLVTIIALAVPVADLGFAQVAVRDAAAKPDDTARVMGSLLAARTALAVVAAAGALVAIVLLAKGGEMLAAGALLCATVLLSGPAALTAVFQLRVRNDLGVGAMTANSVVWTTGVLAVAAAGGGLVAYAGVFLLAALVTTALQVFWALRMTKVVFDDVWVRARRIATTALPLTVGGLLIIAYSRLDQIFVYTIAGEREAGLYATAYRVLEQSHLIPGSIATTLFPIIVASLEVDPARAKAIVQQALDALAVGGFGALGITIPLATPLMGFLFGAPYEEAGQALWVLMAAFILISFSYLAGTLVLPLGLQRRYLLYATAALVFNVTMNLALLPKYGYMVAAWATLLTEALVLSLTARAVMQRLGWRPRLGRMARAAVAATITGLALGGLRAAGVPLGVLLALAVVGYPAAALGLRAIDAGELRALVRR